MNSQLANPRIPGGLALLAAALLFVSPWALAFGGTAAASAWILGALGALLAVKTFLRLEGRALLRAEPGDGWAIAVVGLLAGLMPWLAAFEGVTAALWTHEAAGLALVIGGVWYARASAPAGPAGAGTVVRSPSLEG